MGSRWLCAEFVGKLEMAIEEHVEADRERRRRARLRAEQAERRARRREAWGSASDSDDMIPPSPTSSEEYMDMIQAEASMYKQPRAVRLNSLVVSLRITFMEYMLLRREEQIIREDMVRLPVASIKPTGLSATSTKLTLA